MGEGLPMRTPLFSPDRGGGVPVAGGFSRGGSDTLMGFSESLYFEKRSLIRFFGKHPDHARKADDCSPFQKQATEINLDTIPIKPAGLWRVKEN